HQFTAELAAAELAVAAPLAIGGETLLRYQEFRFAAFPWMRGRSPELDAPEARRILGRSVARLHQVGAVQPFAARPRIGIERLGWEARSQVLASELLAGSPAEQQRQWGELLEGYRQFADFDFAEVRLIEPLRALRMLHHAAWVAHRWRDPAFPRAFPWAAEPRYWEGYLQDLLEQIAVIDEPPLLRQ